MYNDCLRELGKLDCYEQLLQAYLELYFDTYVGSRIIELYNINGCGLLDSCTVLSYREFLYKIINKFNYEIVANFVKKKHEEYERNRIEQECKEEGESDD